MEKLVCYDLKVIQILQILPYHVKRVGFLIFNARWHTTMSILGNQLLGVRQYYVTFQANSVAKAGDFD